MPAAIAKATARLKQAMSRDMADTCSERGLDALPRTMRALNTRPQPHLFDAAPEEVQPETEQTKKTLVRRLDASASFDRLTSSARLEHTKCCGPSASWPRVNQLCWSSAVHRLQSSKDGCNGHLKRRGPYMVCVACTGKRRWHSAS